jgi:hypothetical protein
MMESNWGEMVIEASKRKRRDVQVKKEKEKLNRSSRA